jgi:hypothetical protein
MTTGKMKRKVRGIQLAPDFSLLAARFAQYQVGSVDHAGSSLFEGQPQFALHLVNEGMTRFAHSYEVFHPLMPEPAVRPMVDMQLLLRTAPLTAILIPLQAFTALSCPLRAEDVSGISLAKFGHEENLPQDHSRHVNVGYAHLRRQGA